PYLRGAPEQVEPVVRALRRGDGDARLKGRGGERQADDDWQQGAAPTRLGERPLEPVEVNASSVEWKGCKRREGRIGGSEPSERGARVVESGHAHRPAPPPGDPAGHPAGQAHGYHGRPGAELRP